LRVVTEPDAIPYAPLDKLRRKEVGDTVAAVLAGFAAAVRQFLDHDRLSIYLLTPDGRCLERFAVTTSIAVPGERTLIPLEEVGLTYVIHSNEVLLSADLAADPRINGKEDSLIAAAGFHGLLSAPLRLGGQPVGVLNFVSQTPGYYLEEDAAIAQRIADLVSVFIENLRIERGLREAAVVDSLHRETARLAAEMHASAEKPLHQLSSKLLRLADTSKGQGATGRRELVAVGDQIEEVIRQIHRVLASGSATDREEMPLSEAVTSVLLTFERKHRIKVALELMGESRLETLSSEEKSTILQVLREALANVAEHSNATNVSVHLSGIDDAHMVLSVEDNGKGLTFEEPVLRGGIGFRTMRDRAESIDAHLLVTSTVAQGTRVQLDISRRTQMSATRGLRGHDIISGVRHATATRLLLAESHPLVRDSLTQVLNREADIRVVASAGSQAETIALAKLLKPDLVLLDLLLGGGGGAALISRLRQGERSPIVLTLSDYPTGDDVRSAMKAGASGHVTKAVDAQTLVESIRTVMRGSTVLDKSSASALWKSEGNADLSKRQLEVLQGVAGGETNAEMARRLHLAPKTVERIVSTIAQKLGARNRAHAAAIAVARRVIRPPTAN
jgi:DNA-binding NarL/FixJ family response regulator/signal transduction histidine kinase